MVIKFTSQTIAFDNEIIYIGKIVYVKKSSKSYKLKKEPRFTPQRMALPKKLALALLVLYFLHFFTGISLYFIGDLLWIIMILLALLWDRDQRIKQKASLISEIKSAFFLEIRSENDMQLFFGDESEEEISKFFHFLSHLYEGEVRGEFQSKNIVHVASLDGPTLFPKEYELVVPAGQKNDGNKKKSIEQIANEALENFTEKLAEILEQERQMWRAFSFKAFWQARKNDWQRRKEYKATLEAFWEKLKTKLKL